MKNPEKELAEIKSMMERSTRFLSLSGLSGILAGTFALIGSGLAYYWISYPFPPFGFRSSYINEESVLLRLFVTAMVVLLLSLGSAWILSQQKSKRSATKLWTSASRRFIQALATPLLIGGIFCLALATRGYMIIVAPATLIFYGLALVNSSSYTLSDIKYLGYCQLVLGITSAFYPGFGLLIWSLGFGVLHIVYGTLVYFKYDR